MNPGPELDALILAQKRIEELEEKLENITGIDRSLTFDTCANCLGSGRVSIMHYKYKKLMEGRGDGINSNKP